MADAPAPRQRLDKWLWQARFFKTRSIAAREVGASHVRVNGQKVSKPSTPVAPGDVLTFARGTRVFVIEILSHPDRRGPAPEAQSHYLDRSPEPASTPVASPRVGAKPSGRDRRKLNALKAGSLE